MHAWFMDTTMRVHASPEAELGKLHTEIDALLNEPVEGITREEFMDEAEAEGFNDFAAAMGAFRA